MWSRDGLADPGSRLGDAVRPGVELAELRHPSGARTGSTSGTRETDDGARTEDARELERAIAEFRAAHTDSVIAARRVISPLLDVWSLATAVDPLVAEPIQVLLKALVQRQTTSSGELSECLDRVEMRVRDLAPSGAPLGRRPTWQG